MRIRFLSVRPSKQMVSCLEEKAALVIKVTYWPGQLEVSTPIRIRSCPPSVYGPILSTEYSF